MDTYAVSIACKLENKTVWSVVSAIDTSGTFLSLFEKQNNSDRLLPLSAHVSRSPNGPWQDVILGEALAVLADLELRHILYIVSELEQAEDLDVEGGHGDAFEHLMASAKKRTLPHEKAPKNAKDRLYNQVLKSMKENDLDLPQSVADLDGSYIVKVFVRLGLTCNSPVEFPFYRSRIGLPDICAYCGENGASRPQDLVTKFKVVLPICETCGQAGKKPITARPKPGN